MSKDRTWFTDRKGHIYTEEQWDALLKERRERWREVIGALQVIAYLVAFGAGGTALMIDNIDNRSDGLIIGGVALAFAVGLTIGNRTRPEPEHTTTYGERPTTPPDHE